MCLEGPTDTLNSDERKLVAELFDMLTIVFFGADRAALQRMAQRLLADNLSTVTQDDWRQLQWFAEGLSACTNQFHPLVALAHRHIIEGCG